MGHKEKRGKTRKVTEKAPPKLHLVIYVVKGKRGKKITSKQREGEGSGVFSSMVMNLSFGAKEKKKTQIPHSKMCGERFDFPKKKT